MPDPAYPRRYARGSSIRFSALNRRAAGRAWDCPSVRASSTRMAGRLKLAGRPAVAAADIRRVAHSALRHRIIRNFEGEAEGLDPDKLIDEILLTVPAPGA